MLEELLYIKFSLIKHKQNNPIFVFKYGRAMALNLKKLGTRSISGAVFVLVLLSCLLLNYYTFSIFFFIVSVIGLNEFYKLSWHVGARPYRMIGFAGAFLTYFAFVRTDLMFPGVRLDETLKLLVFMVPFIILATALFDSRESPLKNSVFTIVGIIYVVIPFAILHELVMVPDIFKGTSTFYPMMLLGIIFLIWSNDTFAYLGGSLFGKHKLNERISPGKTWEGTLFGIAVTFGVSFLIRLLMFPSSDSWFWPGLGLLVPVLATVGDLVESMLKREAGIKDSGNLIPGHGGILDRFDSLIFISPFVVVILKLL